MHLSDKLQSNFLHIKFLKYLLVFTVPRKQTLEYGILQFKNCGNENQKIHQATWAQSSFTRRGDQTRSWDPSAQPLGRPSLHKVEKSPPPPRRQEVALVGWSYRKMTSQGKSRSWKWACQRMGTERIPNEKTASSQFGWFCYICICTYIHHNYFGRIKVNMKQKKSQITWKEVHWRFFWFFSPVI